MPSQYKKLRSGGRQLQNYLDKEWIFSLDDGEVKTRQEVEQVAELNKENQVLQKEAEKAKNREEKTQDKAARLSEQREGKRIHTNTWTHPCQVSLQMYKASLEELKTKERT